MSPLLALVPFQALLSFFFHVCGGWEMVLPPSHSPLPTSPSFPSSPTGGKGRGGGAGLPLGTAVAQSISPKPRKFLLPKRKKKRKKIASGHLSSLPIGTVMTGSVGFLGGWLRAGTLSGKSGGAPGRPSARPTLGFSPLPTSFPSKRPTRGGLPLPPGLRATGLYWGPVGYCTALVRESGGTLAPSRPYPLLSFPRAGHFLQ